MHWIDRLVEEIERGNWEKHVVSSGYSVSGPIHIGNLRADGIIAGTIADLLERKGYDVEFYTVIYTQDPFKAKPEQIIWFEWKEYAEKHKGVPKDYKPDEEKVQAFKQMRLRDVPDPYGCHDSWADHWVERIVNVLGDFGLEPKIVSNADLYKDQRGFQIFKRFYEDPKTLEIMNAFRGENKLRGVEEIISGFCPNCKKLGAKVLEVRGKKLKIKCPHCGYEGQTSFEDSKLTWRIEWPTLWEWLNVTVEPYGKDHATPGGSRDCAIKLCNVVLNRKPPFGFYTEWVGIEENGKDLGDMSSSGNLLIEPVEFLKVAEPEVLRYVYLYHRRMMRIVFSREKIYQWVDEFDKAESKYFEDEDDEVKRAYELAVKNPPKEKPTRIRYLDAAMVVQIAPKEMWMEKALKLLKIEGKEIKEEDIPLIEKRLELAKNWVDMWAPDRFKFSLIEKWEGPFELPKEIVEKTIKVIKESKDAQDLEQRIFGIAKSVGSKKFFKNMYLVLLGKDYGPRLAPFIFAIGKENVIKRLSAFL